MRGLSSMFGSKRSDKSSSTAGQTPEDPPPLVARKKSLKIFSTISRKSTTTPQAHPRVSAASEPAQSSGSSSSGSYSLRTPGDDEGLLHIDSKTSWRDWLGSKKIDVDKTPIARNRQWEVPLQQQHSRSLPRLRPPPSRDDPAYETEEESESESEEESEAHSTGNLIITPITLARSKNNLRAMIKSSLQPPFSPSPFLCIASRPSYPRSSNPSSSLSKPETLSSKMHKARLLRRLDAHQLTKEDEFSLNPLGTRISPILTRPSLQLDDEAIPASYEVHASSKGLQKWVLRPYFEDRLVVWLPEAGSRSILPTRVSGTKFGVAALEISEHIDLLAGAALEESELEPSSTNSSSSLLPVPTLPQARNAPNLPSPLRIEHSSSTLPKSVYSPTVAEPETRIMPTVPAIKRGVRFAEDDKDDIPLGYVLRIKKKREDKLKFLQAEKERRTFDEERARQEAERSQREAERQQWEEEKRHWEQEKKAMEEERRQRQYAEEVTAVRARRDASRSGFYVPPTPEIRPQMRESRSSRPPAVDLTHLSPRSQASESAIPRSGSRSPYSVSPASSNPPTPTTSDFFARPESLHSANTTLSSAEDTQQRKSTKKRQSLGAESMQQRQFQVDPMAMAYYPAWSYPVAVLPPMPFYNADMPLLPPTPPFMMHQSRRSSSHNGSKTPIRQESSKSPNNNSTDRVSMSHRSSTHSSRPDLNHRRGSSDDALPPVQRPFVADRRSGSATDVRDRKNHAYSTMSYSQRTGSHAQLPHPSPSSQSSRATTSLPHDYGGRSSNYRRSVIN